MDKCTLAGLMYNHCKRNATDINSEVFHKENVSMKGIPPKTPLLNSKSRQRSGNGAIRKKFPFQKPRWEKIKTISYLY